MLPFHFLFEDGNTHLSKISNLVQTSIEFSKITCFSMSASAMAVVNDKNLGGLLLN